MICTTTDTGACLKPKLKSEETHVGYERCLQYRQEYCTLISFSLL